MARSMEEMAGPAQPPPLEQAGSSRWPRLVSIGGRASAVLAAEGSRGHEESLTCVLTAMDSGSSTGVVRRFFDIPAPGDLRSALAALARPSGDLLPLVRLMEFRFETGTGSDLDGMAFGNLLLAALTLQTGSFRQALDTVASLLNVHGRVLPVTYHSTRLCAELDDGTRVRGEEEVRSLHKRRIRRVFLEDPEARAPLEVCQAIAEAGAIMLGPGCLFTSVLACLAVPGVREALASTPAIKVFVANTTTTPGQTEGFSLADHVEQVLEATGGALDVVTVHCSRPLPEMAAAYQAQGMSWIDRDEAELGRVESLGVRVVEADLLETGWAGVRQLHKRDTIRHDPSRLVRLVRDIWLSSGRAG